MTQGVRACVLCSDCYSTKGTVLKARTASLSFENGEYGMVRHLALFNSSAWACSAHNLLRKQLCEYSQCAKALQSGPHIVHIYIEVVSVLRTGSMRRGCDA